jgi:hypothetical protein
MFSYHYPAPSATVGPTDRQDEPSLRELVRDALISVDLLPFRDFRTETTDLTVRVTFTAAETPTPAWGALADFDVYSDGPAALRVAYHGDLALSVVEEAA